MDSAWESRICVIFLKEFNHKNQTQCFYLYTANYLQVFLYITANCLNIWRERRIDCTGNFCLCSCIQSIFGCCFVCCRSVCAQQQQALRAALALLSFSGRELKQVRGFLSQLTWAWQAFRCQILEHITRVFSGNTHSHVPHTWMVKSLQNNVMLINRV